MDQNGSVRVNRLSFSGSRRFGLTDAVAKRVSGVLGRPKPVKHCRSRASIAACLSQFRRFISSGRSGELYVTYVKVAQGAAGFALIFFETTTSGVGTSLHFAVLPNLVAVRNAHERGSSPMSINL
jgi:hypothetical protein